VTPKRERVLHELREQRDDVDAHRVLLPRRPSNAAARLNNPLPVDLDPARRQVDPVHVRRDEGYQPLVRRLRRRCFLTSRRHPQQRMRAELRDSRDPPQRHAFAVHDVEADEIGPVHLVRTERRPAPSAPRRSPPPQQHRASRVGTPSNSASTAPE